jgi:hypothetical protein
MRRFHALLLGAAFILQTSFALAQDHPDISGHWSGSLIAGQFDPLELIFHIEGESGAWTAKLDIPAHSRFGLTADSVSVRNGNVIIRINSLQAEYYGSLLLSENQVTAMDGDWSQSGEHVPLQLVPHQMVSEQGDAL